MPSVRFWERFLHVRIRYGAVQHRTERISEKCSDYHSWGTEDYFWVVSRIARLLAPVEPKQYLRRWPTK